MMFFKREKTEHRSGFSPFRILLITLFIIAIWYFWQNTDGGKSQELPIIRLTAEEITQAYADDPTITQFAFGQADKFAEGDVFYIFRDNEVICMRIAADEKNDSGYSFKEVRRFEDFKLPDGQFTYYTPGGSQTAK